MTIREIAAELAVSPTAVSYVLNNKPGVGKELKEKITDLLLQNGYSIKSSSAISGTDRQKTILFLYYISGRYLFFKNNNVLPLYLNAVEEICTQQNCRILTKSVNHDTLFDALADAESFDGIILLGIELYESVVLNRSMCSRPFVLLDGYFPDSPIDSINIDNYIGLYQAIDAVQKMGHVKIGHIKSGIPYGCLPDRWQCLHRVLDTFGLSIAPDHVVTVHLQPEQLQEDIKTYLTAHASDLPTVFFADNDYVAISAMAAMQQMGYVIPDDISIVGFDNADISTLLLPNLSTVSVDFHGMAEEAVHRLLRLIQNPSLPVVKSTISPAFIGRESVRNLLLDL